MELSTSILPIVLAPFIGSFLAVVVTRFQTPRSIVFGRSACPHCHRPIAPRDLVPLVSWLVLRGRCRECAQPIGVFYPAMELAALGMAIWAAMLTTDWPLWASCLLGWTLLPLAVIDAKHFLLPHFLTLPLIGGGLLINWTVDQGTVYSNVIGVFAGYGIVLALRFAYAAIRRREGIGLGDATLLAAAGAWVSWSGLPSVMLIAAFLALLVAFLRHVRSGGVALSDPVPFGSYLCAALWIVWLYGPLQFNGLLNVLHPAVG